jgi:hypothetical protein
MMSAISSCPPDGFGRRDWSFRTACQLRNGGIPADIAVGVIAAEMLRTGPEKRHDIERTVARVYGTVRAHSSGLRRGKLNTTYGSFKERGRPIDLVRLFESSPKENWPRNGSEFLQRMLHSSPFVCVGTKPWAVQTVPGYLVTEALLSGCTHVVPNPLACAVAVNRAGQPSRRCEAMVQNRRFVITEFDEMSFADQALRLWHLREVSGVPLVAIITSGRVSLHAWWRVDAMSPDAAMRFMDHAVHFYGADLAFRSPIQMSRLPFAVRPDTGRLQSLVYFNSNLL